MSEKYEIVYPVKIGDRYLLDSRTEKNGASHGNVLASDCGQRPQREYRLRAVADALNRVPQLEAENERLRKRCEELEAELEKERKATRAMPPQAEIDKFLSGMGISLAKEVRVGFDMTLSETLRRDLFAAAALTNNRSCFPDADRATSNDAHLQAAREHRATTSQSCFQMADAMLAEAKKGGA